MGRLIDNIIEFCARNKFIVLIFTAVAVVAGFLAFKNLPLDAIPDLSDTQVINGAAYPFLNVPQWRITCRISKTR